MILPDTVVEKIKHFLAKREAGTIILDVKDGKIVSYRITAAGRIKTPHK